MPSAPCRGAAATSSPVPSQEAAADAAAAPAGGTPVATLLCVQSQQCKRALLTRRASQSSSTGKGAPISAKALRQFFGLKPAQSSETLNKSVPPKQGAPLVGARQKVEQCAAEKLNSFPGDFSGVSQGAEKGSDALSADAATADSAAKIYGAAASAGVSPTLNVGLPCLRPQPASSVVEQCQMAISAEKSAANVSVQVPPKAGGLTHVFNWRHKRRITPYSLSGTASATNEADFNSSEGQTKLQRTGIAASESSPDRFCAGIIPNACGSSGVDTTKQERTGSSRALQQADAVLRKVAAVRAVEPTTASATTPHATCMIWGSGRENTAKAPTAPAPAPPVGRDFGSAYPARLTRPWVDLPEPLILHVLDYGGKEFATTCRRFAGVIRRQRRVLRFSGDASTSSAEALIKAIMSSPSLRLLEITAGGSLSASQIERLSRARSNALPQKLQVLVMRRCNKLTDKSLRTLLLRLRDLRCVDLRDSFSLTDEALSTLGLLPRLERVALGLTVGARGCCRLTCRSIKALLTPQQKQYQQQQEHAQPQHEVEECIAPIKLLSLARCSEMKDFTVLANAKKTLEFLDLRGTAIDDSSATVFASLHNLQVLVLADTAVTTLTVSAVVEGCPKLQMLDLSCTGPVSRDCLFRLAFSLQSLTRLKLSHTAAIDDSLLVHLLAELPLLRFLDVSHCWRVTSAFCDSGFTVASGKQLRRLGLFGCNVERQRVEAALVLAGATNARLSLHNEMALFEMPRVYATMKDLDI
ncbi:hypothetical protein, conserved [Eimeria tenella]|uniref:Leucine rich repeat protein n=1 Tax=Eimeria tenella TaxID=5802 RepID=U6KL29_EIMTE|nr:hypothetical protein, conserved [Eimeria tenella]CDJ37516.1 hypothetical protein, conserved [Eimeria tenella]|eukprot:XP_013228354.1 hypothetical protein, conserved [Eimeria tenella]